MNKTNELCEMELTADTEERLSVLKKKLGATDRYIQQDNRDLAELESRYEKLDISYPVRRFLDDYIACMQTKYERLADLCYLAGVKEAMDTVLKKKSLVLFVEIGYCKYKKKILLNIIL